MFRKLTHRFRPLKVSLTIGLGRRRFRRSISHIISGTPINLRLYQLALRHTSAGRPTSVEGFRESNERLEYLGDAVLGMVIAEYLFKKYPYRDEGFLTEVRSRLVNRESLNEMARKIGLDRLIEFDGDRTRGIPSRSSMHGDALEALVGAVYLDRGFHFVRQFILTGLLTHYNLDTIVQHNANFKSRLIEWAQKQAKSIRFELVEAKGTTQAREFIVQVLVENEPIATGSGLSKKKAEQAAAEKALVVLNSTPELSAVLPPNP